MAAADELVHCDADPRRKGLVTVARPRLRAMLRTLESVWILVRRNAAQHAIELKRILPPSVARGRICSRLRRTPASRLQAHVRRAVSVPRRPARAQARDTPPSHRRGLLPLHSQGSIPARQSENALAPRLPDIPPTPLRDAAPRLGRRCRDSPLAALLCDPLSALPPPLPGRLLRTVAE